MWNLPSLDKDTKAWYLKNLAKETAGKLKNVDATVKDSYMSVLMPGGNRKIIEDLLTLEPVASLKLCEETMDKLLKKLHKGGYNSADLQIFRKAKNKIAKNRNKDEKRVYAKYNKVLETLHKIFDYKGLISSKADVSYELAKRKHARTCTYCGREYIYTFEDLSKEDEVRKVARPDFDHWLSHELYPLLALNYCNLIPCCPICNRTVKGTQMMEIGKHVHPYINQKEPTFKFSYNILDLDKPQGEVIIVNDKDPQEKATIEMFQLRAIYRYHSETELDDMLRIGLKNGKQYVEDYLMNIISGLNISVGDAYRSIYGTELYENVCEERPLSKFKRDILSELGILDLFSTKL